MIGTFVSGTASSLTSQRRAGSAGSAFGPAYLLGGSTANYAQGMYSLLGQQLLGNTSRATAAASTSDKERIEALKQSAALIDSGNSSAGREIAQKLVEKNGNDSTAIRLIAHSYLAEQDYENAERSYARAAALVPDNARFQADVANARALQGTDEEVITEARLKLKSPAHRVHALRLLLYLSNRSPDNIDVYLAMADGFADARKPTQVLGALQEAVKLADEDNVDEVISRAKQLAKDHPTVGMPHNILGRALQKDGQFNEALAEFKWAVDAAPTNLGYTQDLAAAYVARAETKLAANDPISAQSDLNTAQSMYPDATGLSEARARVAAYQAKRDVAAGLYSKSLRSLSTAASKAPNDPQFKRMVAALYTRVAIYFQDIDGDAQALSAFTKAWELDPNNVAARRNVGVLSHERGLNALSRSDYDIAIDHLDRAYQADRSIDSYRQDLAEAYNQRGQSYISNDKLNEAIADYKKGFALDPTNSSLEANLTSAIHQSLAT